MKWKNYTRSEQLKRYRSRRSRRGRKTCTPRLRIPAQEHIIYYQLDAHIKA